MCLNDCLCYHSIINNQVNVTDCNNKNLTRLPKSLNSNTDWLEAVGNDFRDITTIENYFTEVSVLNLTSSNIISITSDVLTSMLKNKELLALRKNKMKYLPKAITHANIETLLLISQNPYECDCDTLWMRDWLMGASNVKDSRDVKCATGKMKGKSSSHICNLIKNIYKKSVMLFDS